MRTDTRQHIIETASRLFYANGYNRTGINEIIKETGIAKATLYHHFASKDDICLSFLTFKHEHFLVDLQKFLDRSSGRKNKVYVLFDFLQMFFKQEDFKGCWCVNTYAEIPREKLMIQQEIRKQKKEVLALIENLVRGELTDASKAEVKKKAKQVYLIYEGAISESHLWQEAWPIKTAQDMCKSILE